MRMHLGLVTILFVGLIHHASAACKDQSVFCGTWKFFGYCKSSSRHYQYMKENCPETCSFSCPTTAPPAGSCVDRLPDYCKGISSKCNDDGYKDYVKQYCQKTCGFCGTSAGTTIAPPSISTSSPDVCGVRGDGYTRIVGGTNAKPGDWPWQVQVDYLYHSGRYWCGGTILNDEWILSAAHCFEDDTDPSSYKVYLGEHDIRTQSPNEQKHALSEIILHPSYDANSMNNDFALIRLKKKASFNKYVRAACFPDASINFPVGEECYVTGWGALRSNGPEPRILQQAKIPLVSATKCKSAMGVTASQPQFCAGYDNKAIDSCQGDSGGPLVCRKQKNGMDKWYLWGVVSWGYDCAKPGYYGVYASAQKVNQWVRKYAFKS